MLSSLDEVVQQARGRQSRRLVVAGANHATTLEALADARREGLIGSALLVVEPGEVDQTKRQLADGEDHEVVACSEPGAVAARAVELVRGGAGHVLLKGGIQTGELLRAVFDRQNGLRTDRTLSDVLVSEDPTRETPRLIGVADGGVNVAPSLESKKQIIENSVGVFHRLGFDEPRVAVLCASEKPSDAMPHTVEARTLADWNRQGRIEGCVVDGPLALDNALSVEAARAKGLDSPVAGRADILVVSAVEAGNILGKAFRYLARKPVAHVIDGGRAPVLIPSRTESAQDKLYSIALGILCS